MAKAVRVRIREFLRFCLVGFIGYVVDASLLELLVYAGLGAASARLISIPIALQCTYVLHGIFTYRGHGGFTRKAWLRFMSLNLLGALINYLVFLAALQLLPIHSEIFQRQVALFCGMAIALWFNYWANRRFVFRTRGTHE